MKGRLDTGYSWIVLICCFIIYMLAGGCLKTFGILYGELQGAYNSGSGNTLSVGSTAGFIQSIISPVANSLSSRFSFRRVTFSGGLFLSLAFLSSAFVPSLQWLFLTYSVLGGIGLGCLMAPSATIVNFYFDKRKNLANGIVVASSGVCSLFLPHLYRHVFDTYQHWGALVLLSGVFLQICVAASMLRQPKILTDNQRQMTVGKMESNNHVGKKYSSTILTSAEHFRIFLTEVFNFDWLLLRNVSYVLYVISISFCFLGYTANFFLLPPLVESFGFGKKNSAFIMSLLGLCEVISRIFMGWFLDLKIVSVSTVFIFNVIIGSVAATIVPFLNKYVYICIYTAAIGIFPGTFYTFIPSLLVEELGLKRLPRAYGLLFMFAAVFYGLGNPALGWLEDSTGSWNLSFHVVGILFIISAIVMVIQKMYSARKLKQQSTSAHDPQEEIELKSTP